METDSDLIKDGDYIIVKRQNYTKIHKLTKTKCFVMLGKDEIDLTAVIGERYWTTYKLERKGKSRAYILKKCKKEISFTDEIIKEVPSGVDNREIKDDGMSQKLSTEEIINLRTCGLSGQEIVSQLVENSTTFINKTEYSQEKYLKKKEKKYFEYVTVRKPTLRLISEVLMRQPQKVLGLRMDTLAQITAVANVRSGGTYILYENGCMGIVAAALLDRLGPEGNIIHVHPGCSDHPTLAVLSLNLPKERFSQLRSIDIHKLCDQQSVTEESKEEKGENNVEVGQKRKSEESTTGDWKRRKIEAEERIFELLSNRKVDSLIIVGKEHPKSIFTVLVKYLDISRPFVVYCPIREPLQELYCDLKSRSDVICIRITESFMRGYQILPDRTHPDINMSGSGGYLLTGILVNAQE
ncbi:UNVERIFIED_CONTAM: hypothetical protein PYX00_003744 [Menopon gallinae]|uniref:tRNA (adenine(58)-N(1))-methyltransferase non-catalytic subunit TRM6 n=1 Tax=Menopon gallinae TaxID=328185 RepID=A0AAW2I153_9NEOP